MQILCKGPNLTAERVRVREEGQAVRDNLRENMPGPTRRETRLLNFVLIFLFKFENKKFHPSFSIISLLLYLNIYLFLVLLFIIPQL